MRFSEILLTLTTVSGLIWLLDALFFKKKRVSDSDPIWVEYAKSFFPILLIVFLLRSFLLEPFRIPSGSMRPTLLEGDLIVVNKFDYGLRWPIIGTPFIKIGTPQRGDIIVFKHIKRDGQSIDMIKRVVGLPGDHIEYKNKVIYVNGKAIEQSFQTEKMDNDPRGYIRTVREFNEQFEGEKVPHKIYTQGEGLYKPYYEYDDVVVPENHYFAMGDNRDGSEDSRFWGFVDNKDIQGRAFAIWMSWDGVKHRVRFDRIGYIH